MASSSWFSKMIGTDLKLDNLENVLVLQLEDLLSAEQQLTQALPKMADAASDPQLRNAFVSHLGETRVQEARLKEIFRLLGKKPQGETCEAMQGLISEGEEVISLDGDPEVKDAALIASAQRVEHYEMAGYGCARAFAQRLGKANIAALLQETLEEESHANEKLTQIAESSVNLAAARA
jgi:ferritin-like metal-binding protein YciE